MAAIFDLRNTQTSESIPTSLYVLPDPENMGIGVGISLLSRIEAEINRLPICLRSMAAIFYLRHTHISDSIPIELSLRASRLRKHGHSCWNFVAVLYTRWAIYVTSYLLPVNGRHLWSTTHTNIGQYFHFFPQFLTPKTIYCRWNFVAIKYKLIEISAITLFQPPSWISDFRFHPTKILIAPLKSLTPKTWGSRQNFVPS